ncbi:hypothetical protein GCM10010387_04630 [Streptomyces inusitatus]|uniref:Uncharacterized protein n=1 Tax=Streptomyces inusitatus TaxID=68221 RepID=A0A918UJN2_9ACTN|nr:hypothetical protein [Streptomyces inusitatus]GGZ15379.1 hypothetical protein GCM10010387_04630 [Streptomyces inusitatus]
MEVTGWGAREVRIPPGLAGRVVVEATGGLINPHFWLVADIASKQGTREEKLFILGGWPWEKGRPQALIDPSSLGNIRIKAPEGSWVSRWKLTFRKPEEVELVTAESRGTGSRILRTPDRPGSVTVKFGKAGGRLYQGLGSRKNTEPLAGHYGPMTHTVEVAANSFLTVRDGSGDWGPMMPWTLHWTASD